MIGPGTGTYQKDLRTLFGEGTSSVLSDRQLMERFLARGDAGAEAAFAALVARHGAMVWGVCRRVLADSNDADDAFQATFLILVKKAHAVRVSDSLGPWLYGVSCRVALRARANSAQRNARRQPIHDEHIPLHDRQPDVDDVRAVLDEEIGRLPERYRAPLTLCDLGGQTHEEAARHLRCPVGTVKSRLSRGREQLRARLTRRGFAPSAALLASVFASEATARAVPAPLAEATVRAALALTVATGIASSSSLLLAEGVLRSMVNLKLKWLMISSVALSIAASGTVVRALQTTEKTAAKAIAAKGREDVGKDDRAESGELPDRLREELALLDVRLEQKKANLAKSKAQAELALTIIAINKRLNDRQKGLVSQEEMAKAEAEVNVAKAGVDLAQAEVREAEIRLGNAKRLENHPLKVRAYFERRRSDSDTSALEQRVSKLERKLELLTKQLVDQSRNNNRQ